MLELKMELEGREEEAFRFIVAEINEKRKVPFTEQEVFRQQGIFYIKRMLEKNLPVEVDFEEIAGMNDEQQVALYSRLILDWKEYVQMTINKMDTAVSMFKKVKNWLE